MSVDLIKRAADRLARDRISMPCDLAPELPPRIDLGSAPSPEFPRPSPDLPRPSFADLLQSGAAGQAPRISSQAQPLRVITLDVAALRAAGILTPRAEATRLVEEFRIIKRPLVRTALRSGDEHFKGANLIMVTSAQPGEGKTFVACNVAMSIASERNLKVLLIDSDFQRPGLSRLLGLEKEAGLLDLLADPDLELTDVMLQTDFDNVAVIPAGRCRDHAPELLASRRMSMLVEEIAEGAADRLVIFDAAPVLANSEPAVLAFHVGQTVMVVQAERTERRTVEEAVSLLRGCPNIGVVLNKTQIWPGSQQFGAYERDTPSKPVGA